MSFAHESDLPAFYSTLWLFPCIGAIQLWKSMIFANAITCNWTVMGKQSTHDRTKRHSMGYGLFTFKLTPHDYVGRPLAFSLTVLANVSPSKLEPLMREIFNMK